MFTNKVVAMLNGVPSPIVRRFGSDSVIAKAVRPIVNFLMPSDPTEVIVRSGPGKGMSLLIYPRTEKFFWTGTWEVSVQRALVEKLKAGMTFWDVGANVGFFTVIASRLVGDRGQVHAFEPMEENRKRLMAAVRLNKLSNVTVHDCALAASSGEAILHEHESPQMWTLMPGRGLASGLTVACRTLNEVANKIGSPDVIKIDVEGAEIEVLKGGMDFLRHSDTSLIVEFGDECLLGQGRSLLPFYKFDQLDSHNWSLKHETAVTDDTY